MAPQITASPVEGVTNSNMPTPTVPSNVKRQDASAVSNAMTTPYVFPSTCTFSYAMTKRSMPIASVIYGGRFGSMSEEFLYISIDENPHWQTCQPPGNTKGYVGDQPSNVYRGAVCPEGWIAFDVGLGGPQKYSSLNLPETWSTAKCCKSGDSLTKNIWQLNYKDPSKDDRHYGDVCVSLSIAPYDGLKPPDTEVFPSYTVDYWTTTSQISVYTQYITFEDDTVSTKTGSWYPEGPWTTLKAFTGGRAFYPPVSVEWLEEDNSTLDPKWPTLTSDMLIPSYPAEEFEYKARKGLYDNRGRGPVEVVKQEPSIPNKVAIPVIAVLAVLLLAALAGVAFLLWKGKNGGRPMLKAKNSSLSVPLQEDEAGSTARLAGGSRGREDMELRER